jgi:hypothetical protein
MNGEPKAVKVTLVTGFLSAEPVDCEKHLREVSNSSGIQPPICRVLRF